MNTDEVWLAQQFGQACLGDARRSRRAQKLALGILQTPDKGLPAQTKTWGGCKAAYRLLHSQSVQHSHLLQPHCQQTRQDAADLPVALFIQDTTELDFTSMTQAQGYGPIGDHRGQGLFVHTLLCLNPEDEQLLGVAAQRCWARQHDGSYKHTETRAQRYRRKDKESDVWHQVLADVGPVPQGRRWVSIGDRGSDSFVYWAKAREMGWQCLSRIFLNRRTNKQDYLVNLACSLAPQAQLSLHQRARPAQAQRTLELQLAWQAVEIQPARNDPNQSKMEPLQATVLRCWDEVHEVQWLLLATWPIKDEAQARQCVQWYAQRWRIEEFHKCLKSGCRMESSQLKQADATQALLAFCSVAAARLLELGRLARAQPQVLAKEHIDALYVQVLSLQRGLKAETLTMVDYWREVAKLGGFLGRKHDKAPGWQTLWRGQTKLDDLVSGYLLAIRPQCG